MAQFQVISPIKLIALLRIAFYSIFFRRTLQQIYHIHIHRPQRTQKKNYSMKGLRMLRSSVISIACIAAGPASAQNFVTQADCSKTVKPTSNTDGESHNNISSESKDINYYREYTTCLEKQLRDMIDLVNATLKTATNTVAELSKLDARYDYILNGPVRDVKQRVESDMVAGKTVGYYASGRKSKEFDCHPLKIPEGFVKFGLEYGKEVHVASVRGCPEPNWCDGHDEWCRQISLSQGCVVNKEWLDWFKGRASRHRIPVNYQTVCGE